MELSAKIVDGRKLLTVVAKKFHHKCLTVLNAFMTEVSIIQKPVY